MKLKYILFAAPFVLILVSYLWQPFNQEPAIQSVAFIAGFVILIGWIGLLIFAAANISKPKYKPLLVKVTAIGGTYCPKCKQDGGFFHCHYPPEEPYYRCENCNSKITDSEYAELMKPKELKEKDLEIYDVWESPNGNLFLKVSDDYSLALGTKGDHAPTKAWGDLEHTQYVKSSDVFPVVKVGRIVFDEDAVTNYRRSL